MIEGVDRLTVWPDDRLTDAHLVTPPPNHLVSFPVTFQSETIGHLHVASRAPDEPFSAADRRLLEDLVRQAGAAAQAVRLAADLQHSREQLVTAREEERRRLRRDLHDGLGSQFAALHLRAETLRTLIKNNPPAEAVAVELRDEIRAAVTDIRRLVYELRPPALDELGLTGAMRALAAQRTSANGLQVLIDAPEPLPPLPAAVEVAAYRITQEALTNVVRHAHAHTCHIRLALADELRLEISDDGVGLPAHLQAGVGLRSMRERAAELGGACRVETNASGGTYVATWLPLKLEANNSIFHLANG
ncbi:MAG: sensor histidine kinase [Anaerolineales bacterium]|nr:sensor histidine kinase [Anaerolineales bacterium]